MAMEHDLYTNIKVIDVCTEFNIFEVKVPIIFRHTCFFGTQGWTLIIKVECNHYSRRCLNQGDLTHHINSVHKNSLTFTCDYPKCDRSQNPFNRKDHYRNHLRDYHKEAIGGLGDGERHI